MGLIGEGLVRKSIPLELGSVFRIIRYICYRHCQQSHCVQAAARYATFCENRAANGNDVDLSLKCHNEIQTDNVNLTKKSMSSIADLIANSRKSKNLTQEQLAELSKVNLRTIQRIENNENTPREYTLKLICEILEIDIPNSESEILKSKPNQIEFIINYFFLMIINLTLMGIIGWTTLASEANINSKFAGFLLSFFIPIFIVFITKNMSKTERLLKFGSGFSIYIILSIIIVGFPKAFVSGLLPCLSICLVTLFYGDKILNHKNAA